jgi:SpoIID/LytB domain protein
LRRTRIVRHAGIAWAVALACAWALAASCRSARVASSTDVEPQAVSFEPSAYVQRPSLRVGVRVSSQGATIAARSGVRVHGAAADENVWLLRELPRASFEPFGAGGRLRLRETGDVLSRAVVQPVDASELIRAGDDSFRGVLEVIPAEPLRLTVVNVVQIEDYLRGVVPNELAPAAFPQLEALKAQAVAARSYALAHLGDYASRGYDLCATAACQVYRGAGSEQPLSDRAVAETRGVVASWHGRPIHAYYTSSCGGHTEAGTAVFDDSAPYLRGVACPAEQAAAGGGRARGRPWQVRLAPRTIARRLSRYGSIGDVQDLVPARVGVSGRVVELRVVGSAGELDLRGQRVRLGLGLRASLFVVRRETDAAGQVPHFVFSGSGWGHGVGLCQLGAAGMAREGASFDAILKHYYTGVSVGPLDEEPSAFLTPARAPS